VEYRDPIDLKDCPSNMEIGLCWYLKVTNNKWTHKLIYHLMIDLETIIALASMPYIIDLDAYELHPGDEKVFKRLYQRMLGFTLYVYTYDRGSLLFKSRLLYLC
jgi:hypothetical protein